jgi:hypothetical protein
VKEIFMASRFERYAYKEIVNRPDRGAGVITQFCFQLSARELLNFSTVKSAAQPSLHEVPLPSEWKDGCLLSLTEWGSGDIFGAEVAVGEIQARNVEPAHHAVKKDVYAIFATIAYLTTIFDRLVGIDIRTADQAERALVKMQLNADSFTQGPDGFRKQALAFFAALILRADQKDSLVERNDKPSGRDLYFTLLTAPKSPTFN